MNGSNLVDLETNLAKIQPTVSKTFLIILDTNLKNNKSKYELLAEKYCAKNLIMSQNGKINKAKIKEISAYPNLYIHINISYYTTLKTLKTYFKTIQLIRKYCSFRITYSIEPYVQDIEKYKYYVQTFITGLFILDKYKRYEFIYDKVCEELDDNFIKNNYCDFKNDKCIANRKGVSTKDIMGCCYSFKNDNLKTMFDRHLCKYFDNNKKCCSTKCMTCKLYTCHYLQKQGIKFKAKDNILLTTFFNKKQLRVLSCNFFITKERLLNKLMEDNKMPYIIYYLFNQEYIDVEL